MVGGLPRRTQDHGSKLPCSKFEPPLLDMFLLVAVSTYTDIEYTQFGYGARTCIGKNISIMEMGKFVPQILRHFELEWASPEPHWKTRAAWFWRQSGILVKFKSRQKS